MNAAQNYRPCPDSERIIKARLPLSDIPKIHHLKVNMNYLSKAISNCVRSFRVYRFHHDDEMRYSKLCWSNDTLRVLGYDVESDFVTTLEGVFSKAGWEGDGQIQQTLLPPFCAIGNGDTGWFPIFVVKQENNGTIFVASPKELGCGAQISG